MAININTDATVYTAASPPNTVTTLNIEHPHAAVQVTLAQVSAGVRYLVNEHVVEVVGEAPGEGVPQLGEQQLLLRHGRQLLVAWRSERETSRYKSS